MLDSFTCPFCNHTMPVVSSTYTEMDARYKTPGRQGYSLDTKYSLKIHMYKCPNCQKITSIANYAGTELPQNTGGQEDDCRDNNQQWLHLPYLRRCVPG